MKSSKNFSKKLANTKRVEFLDFLAKFKGYSDLTLKTYDEAIQEALRFIEIEQNAQTTTIDLMPYRLHISEKNPKTVAKKLSALRSFFDYLNDNGYHVVLLGDESVKVPKTLPKPISHKHIEEALQNADFEARFVVVMIYTLGLRISELADIRLEDISEEWVRIRGKGNKQRDVPLLEGTKEMIEQFLEKKHPKRYLFEKNGEKLSQNSLRYIINKTFAKIGLKVTPHQLRHSFATSLLNGGAAIADVSELMGHASMATTQIYTKLASSLKKENYLKSHPLCSKEV